MTEINVQTEIISENYDFDTVEFNEKVKSVFKNFLNTPEIAEKCVLKGLIFDKISFDFVLCENREIREINRDYRNIDKPTDVITFAIFADSPQNERFIQDGEINLGEVVISLERVTEQAEENSNSFKKELYTVTAHGILHLLGFDHLTEDDYNFVVKHQERVLKDVAIFGKEFF